MKISGRILDSNNEPLHLANITIITGSETNKFGTIANEEGYFELDSNIINEESQFRISYVGFSPQYYKASELQGRTVMMEEDNVLLDAVVVVSPKSKPKNTNTSEPSNIKQHFKKHKIIYAGLGGALGLILILTSIKKLK